MGYCSAPNCTSHSKNRIRMHKFPADAERRRKWIVNCGRHGWVPGPRAELCHVHFEESQYEQNLGAKIKKLKPNAIPTLFNFNVSNPPAIFTPRGIKGRGLLTLQSNENDSSSADCVQAQNDDLLRKIALLEEENRNLKLENIDLKTENAKLKTEIQQKNACLQSFLSEEQVAASRSSKHFWSNEGVTKGLKLRFALGKFGYTFLRSTGYPAPSYSTLNRRIKGIPVDFGVLHGMLTLLKTKVDDMDPSDKMCAISFDEMEIAATQDFNTSSRSFVGNITLGSVQDVGNHYTVVMLRGLKSPWKQIVAHEITGHSCSGPKMKELLFATIDAVRGIGLTVKASTSDMGNNNTGLWKSLGVSVTRSTRNTTYHVNDSDAIHSVADVPHLLKNMRNAFLSRTLIIPDDICLQQSLPSKFVLSNYVKNLWKSEVESDTSLRSLHHLNKEHLFPSHFMLMNVASAVRLFSVKTAAALEKAVNLKQISKEAFTTAWFIRLINEWFTLMTARHPKKGITLSNQAEKFQFLENFIYVMQNIDLIKGWKPLQTGMIMSSLSVINLTKELFETGYTFFLPGRLSQDALENIFSQIRRKSGSKPTALQARRALKLISVSQFISNMKDTNYFTDSDSHLLDFSKQNLPLPIITRESNLPISNSVPTSAAEENDIFYIASSTLNAVLKLKLCSFCTEAVTNAIDSTNVEVPPHRKLLNQYCNMGGLKVATSGIYRICREAERKIQINKENLVKLEAPIDNQFISEIKDNCNDVTLPICCSLKEKIITHYLIVRCKGIKNHLINKKKVDVSYASASVAKKNNKLLPYSACRNIR